MIVKKQSVEMEFSYSNVFKTGGKLENILSKYNNETSAGSADENEKFDM